MAILFLVLVGLSQTSRYNMLSSQFDDNNLKIISDYLWPRGPIGNSHIFQTNLGDLF